MSDAPSPWELQRQIDQLRRDLSGIAQSAVTAQLFAAEGRRVDERLAEIVRDVRECAEDVTKLAASIEKEQGERRTQIRWLLASVAVPVAALLANVYLGLSR